MGNRAEDVTSEEAKKEVKPAYDPRANLDLQAKDDVKAAQEDGDVDAEFSVKLDAMNANDESHLTSEERNALYSAYDNLIEAIYENATIIELQNFGITDAVLKFLLPKMEELQDVTMIDLSDNKITKIDGLFDLENLQKSVNSLNLSDNKITTIDGIEKFENLKYLHIKNNNISDLSGTKKLKKLVKINQ